ncbi:hypothetical protein KCP76_18740 [Salmonella enterica subsp. enterica serovar Weltevreden]|nr:hypothetical protein KCP76_18740 [Salmonella enterica subsp. enterica serovar Weltevreden]
MRSTAKLPGINRPTPLSMGSGSYPAERTAHLDAAEAALEKIKISQGPRNVFPLPDGEWW